MGDVIAKLVLLLIAEHRKRRNRGYELVVAKCLKPRRCVEVGAERKRQRQPKTRISMLGMMERAGFQSERAQPGRAEFILLVDQKAEVIRPSRCARRGQRCLLNQVIPGVIHMQRTSKKPLRFG